SHPNHRDRGFRAPTERRRCEEQRHTSKAGPDVNHDARRIRTDSRIHSAAVAAARRSPRVVARPARLGGPAPPVARRPCRIRDARTPTLALMPSDVDTLVGRALEGDRVAVAKLLSLVEQGGAGARAVARRLHPHTGNAWSVGITGAPGAGKSTLTDALVACMRADDLAIGVPAGSPSNPLTGGRSLRRSGRMQPHAAT